MDSVSLWCRPASDILDVECSHHAMSRRRLDGSFWRRSASTDDGSDGGVDAGSLDQSGSLCRTAASVSVDPRALERLLAGHHLEEHATEGPDIGPLVHGLARACSGLMYAAVPRIIPTPASCAGVVIVGDIDTPADIKPARLHRLRQPEVQHLHGAVRRAP